MNISPTLIPFMKRWVTTLSNAIEVYWRCYWRGINYPCILHSTHVILELIILQCILYTFFYGNDVHIWSSTPSLSSCVLQLSCTWGSMMTSIVNPLSFDVPPHPIICHSMFPHIQSSVFHVYFTSVSVFFNVPSHLSVSFAIHNSRVFLCSLCVHQLGAHATSEVSSELLTFIKLSIKYGCHSCNLNTNYHNIVSHCPPN